MCWVAFWSIASAKFPPSIKSVTTFGFAAEQFAPMLWTSGGIDKVPAGRAGFLGSAFSFDLGPDRTGAGLSGVFHHKIKTALDASGIFGQQECVKVLVHRSNGLSLGGMSAHCENPSGPCGRPWRGAKPLKRDSFCRAACIPAAVSGLP